jgi:hypothetical protein
MSKLPDAETLAKLVTNVTQTMCATSFVPGDPLARGESLYLQMAMIQLTGDPDITIVLSSDVRGSRALGAAFYGINDGTLSQQMIDDAITELLNMVAGQICTALQSDHAMGLPKRVRLTDIVRAGVSITDDAALLRSEGAIDLGLWILETKRPPAAAERPPAGKLRSFFGK